jgi:hypothetical protein
MATMGSQGKAYLEDEMRLWGQAEKVMYPAGIGGHCLSFPDAPMERASTGEPFTSGPLFHTRSEEKAN